MSDLLQVILPVFVVIGFGYLAVWRGLFSDAGVEGLMKFTQRFAIPCLLFRAIAGLDLTQSFDLRLLAAFYAGAVAGFLIGLAGARVIFGRPWEDAVAIGFISLFSNSVLLGLPIAERAYGADSLAANYAIIAVHSPFCYALGITSMELARNRGQSPVRMLGTILNAMFHNALILGIALGFAVNLLGIELPGVVSDAIDMMIRAALPVALFGVGGVLVRFRPEGDIGTIAFAVTLSLIVHPGIAWLVGSALGLNQEMLRAAVITAAMAPGINTYIFADLYGRARRVAASSVLLGTALSLLTVWVWLQVLA